VRSGPRRASVGASLRPTTASATGGGEIGVSTAGSDCGNLATRLWRERVRTSRPAALFQSPRRHIRSMQGFEPRSLTARLERGKMASARTDTTLGKGRHQGRQTLSVCGSTPSPAAVGAVGARPEFQRLVTARCWFGCDRREGGASSSSSQLETDCAIRRNTSAQRRTTPYQSPNARAPRPNSKRGRSLNTCSPRCRSGEPRRPVEIVPGPRTSCLEWGLKVPQPSSSAPSTSGLGCLWTPSTGRPT
jgi:hypothetical protein